MMDYKQVYKSEATGSTYSFGIDIKIASPNGESEGIRRAARQAAELLEEAITRDFYANDSQSQERAKLERLELVSCFADTPIFVRPIPNGYCNRACCEHRPWFQITTRIGPITIGWRKSVISIHWSDSIITAKAKDLFPDEDVTKDGQMIHAWGYDKAREYIARLIAAV